MKRVNELKGHIQNFELDGKNAGMRADPAVALTESAKRLFNDLDKKGESFTPYEFVQTMRDVFPMFNEKDDKGNHKQQDADECYTQFMTNFQYGLTLGKKKEADGDAEMVDDTNENQDIVERLFGLQL